MDDAAFRRAYGQEAFARLLAARGSTPPRQSEPTPPAATLDPVWLVFLDGVQVDRVCIYAPGCSADMVKRDLLHHGGYDPQITVRLGGP